LDLYYEKKEATQERFDVTKPFQIGNDLQSNSFLTIPEQTIHSGTRDKAIIYKLLCLITHNPSAFPSPSIIRLMEQLIDAHP